MDAKTEELRAAHDALAEGYAGRLAHVMDELPDPGEKQPQGYLIARRC